MSERRRLRSRRARATLLWSLGFFAGTLLVFAVAVERWLPYARDPEFEMKLDRLQERLREAPDNPLVVMLGSSRTLLGFAAGDVDATLDGTPATVFNFGISGGGPFLELLCLRRLLAEGIHPDLLLVEVLPPILNTAQNRSLEEVWLQSGRMRLGEIGKLKGFHSSPARLVRRWGRARLRPWDGLHRLVHACLNPEDPDIPFYPPEAHPGKMDAYGWEPHFLDGISAEERAHFLGIARTQYQDSMGPFQISDHAAGALSRVVDLCRRESIPMALVVMPEGHAFRDMYPPGLRDHIKSYVGKLASERGLPIVDASAWLADEDFWDSHHALPPGAAKFTERLAEEAISPLLQIVARRHRRVPQESQFTFRDSVNGVGERGVLTP